MIPDYAACDECGREDRPLVEWSGPTSHYDRIYLCDRHAPSYRHELELWTEQLEEFLATDKSNDWSQELEHLRQIRVLKVFESD